jgi:hypothetical protein
MIPKKWPTNTIRLAQLRDITSWAEAHFDKRQLAFSDNLPVSMISKTEVLVELVILLAQQEKDFAEPLGPGAGNARTNSLTAKVVDRAKASFGCDFSEFRYGEDQSSRYDFYFPDEATVVEIAWGLPNPNTEFEKDILKALVGREYGHAVDRLVLVSRPGAIKKCSQPGRKAVVDWANKYHALQIVVVEVDGDARIRQRKRK